jgi:hypothetical protein
MEIPGQFSTEINKPDGVCDDLGRKSVALVADGAKHHGSDIPSKSPPSD